MICRYTGIWNLILRYKRSFFKYQKIMTKQICMVAYTKYSLDNRVRREAEALAAYPEFEVTSIVPKENPFPKNYTFRDVNIIELNCVQYQGKSKIAYLLSYITFFLLSLLYITQIFLRRKLDIIHIHNMPDLLVYTAIIPRLFGTKIVLDIHDTMPETYLSKFEGRVSKFLYLLLCFEESVSCLIADKIICVNHIQREALVSRGVPYGKINIILNVPDHNVFCTPKFSPNKPNHLKSFRLVYHGTLSKRLGIDIIIRTVSKLATKIPGIEFVVFGEGDDREEFIDLTKQLEIQDYINFFDPLPIEQLIPELLSMHVGIVGNRKNIATELMLPVKMLEYIALEIPVIVPKLKTIKYYFTDEMVSFYEPEDIFSMEQAIINLFSNFSKSHTQTQRAAQFLDRYGWEKHHLDLIFLYKNFC